VSDRVSIWSVLRLRDYRRLWFADVVSDAGSFITFIALAVYVHQLTGTAVAVGIALSLRTIPYFTIGPIAGTLADRLDRRLIMVSCDLARAGLVVLLPFTTSPGQAYAIAFASGLFGPMFRPARAALIPSVVGRDEYVRALAVAEVSHNVLHMIGPALGGLAVFAVGARNAFFLDAGTFVFSAMMVVGVSVRGAVRERHARVSDVGRDIVEGARILWRDRIIRSALPSFALMLLGFEGAIGALVVYVRDHLGRSAGAYGIVLAAGGLGTTVATMLLARRPPSASRTWPLLLAAVSPLALLFLALQPGYWALLIVMLAAGLATAGTLYVDTFIAERIPDDARGRAFSLHAALLTAAEAIGILGIAALADAADPSTAIAVGGIVSAVLALAALAPGLAALRSADAERAASPPTAPAAPAPG
jgi:MFS transporter, NRE family, putaive nickel resistance protein